MEYDYKFLEDLNEIQKEVCMNPYNYILTACPGSGKTRTITYRLAYLAEKYSNSKKLNIAITYTNRAADEIEDRLSCMGIDKGNVWTGTIHQFCMKYIIRPYAMYHEKLRKGYQVIDEFVKEEYIKQTATDKGIKYTYVKDLYSNKEVLDEYVKRLVDQKKMDFDMILQYSYEILSKNRFVAENVARIIRSIHVDEYQDTNELQYIILAQIINENTKINLLFVGDVNQAIYRNLGGVAKSADEIRVLFPIEFKEKTLVGCYRSTQRIVDYYVNYEVSSTGVISVSEVKDKKGRISLDQHTTKEQLANKIACIIQEQLEKGINEDEICVVAPQWYQIYPMANELRKLLPDNKFDAPDISPIKYDPLNVFCLIAKLLFTQADGHRYTRRKNADDIINMFREDYEVNIQENIDRLDVLKIINATTIINEDGIQTLKNTITNVFRLLSIEIKGKIEEAYNYFFEKIIYRIQQYDLKCDYKSIQSSFSEKKGIVINTIHGVKGEEYITVIGFDLLNGHLPHWDYIYNKELKLVKHEETMKMLYVLCSRAKENLFLISERGRKTKRDSSYKTTEELACCCFDYD